MNDALGFMGLAESARKLVKTYSGGMVRRLELAQAMLHCPEILFLDEPTIGLDPIARHSVWDRLRDLRRDYGMTVLITTHDMEEAETLCDELAILHAGRVAVVGKPAALREGVGEGASMDDVFAHYAGHPRGRGFPRDRPDAPDRPAPGLRTGPWSGSSARARPSRKWSSGSSSLLGIAVRLYPTLAE